MQDRQRRELIDWAIVSALALALIIVTTTISKMVVL
jgi:hypothetical protein